MNPYLPPNNTVGNTLTSPPPNAGVRPPLDAGTSNGAPVRLIRTQQMTPTERNNESGNQQIYRQNKLKEDIYQSQPQSQQIHRYQQQQQNNVFQSQPQQQINVHRNDSQQRQNNVPQVHPSQQLINIQRNNSQYQINAHQNHPQQQYNQEKFGVLSSQDSNRSQINSSDKPNVPAQYNQSGKIPLERQRTQPAAPLQTSDSRQPIKPPLSNNSNETFPNPSQPSNFKQMGTSRLPQDRIQPNLHNDRSENYKAQLPADNFINPIKKSSDVDSPSFNVTNAHPKSNEITLKSQMEPQPGSGSFVSMADPERKSDLMNSQTALSSLEIKSRQNNVKLEHNEVQNSLESGHETTARSDSKSGKRNQKESNKNGAKGESITIGMVQKNIKFFEENDTAKKPLTPIKATVQKKEKNRVAPFNVIKSEFQNNDYESGVDETPVVHPNLGNIFQAPRKVAKISRLTAKRLKKNKSKTLPNFCNRTPNNKKPQKMKTFGSNEELLAFFENSKLWRKYNRYEKSAVEQNATKQKLVYKPTTNGDISPKKTPSKLPTPSKINPAASPTKSPLKSPGTPGAKSLPKTPENTAPSTPLIKKVPMNKIQVGAAPSPNLKTVRSKVGSLANTTHKPGGGNVKIESRKIDLSKAQPRIEAKNDQYKPSGGDKKISQVKLQWSAKSKIGSLENSTYKPGGGDKKIESVKLDFKEKAKPKVGSKDNVKHVPGGGNIKIENQKLEFKAQSKVGSLDNVKHKPGGGDIKIFDDKTYLRQVSGNCSEGRASGTQSDRELLTENDIKGRSAPTTPGRKTTISIKKMFSFQSFEDTPNIEKVTAVTVTSQTPKNEKKNYESPIKQQIKVTYSKISSSKEEDIKGPVEVVKTPAKNYAPVLRPVLSTKDVSDNSDSERNY